MEDKLNKILDNHRKNEGNEISILQGIQEEFGYVPEDAVNWFSKKLGIHPSIFFGIATFYSQFHLKPRGKNIITICCGTACHVKGADSIISTAQRELKLGEGKDTSDDGGITLEKVACLGTCSYAPVMIINKEVHGKVTPDKVKKELKTLKGKKTHG